MFRNFLSWFGTRWKEFTEKRFGKILEINRRYAQPRIHTNRWVWATLLFLRLYLLLLVGILFFKFFTLL